MNDPDPFKLERFVSVQQPAFVRALDELRAGRKQSHWMWFIFPQMKGLGFSSMAAHYGIGSLAEARAYLAHPILGMRLVRCTEAVLALGGLTPREIFGSPDDTKFCSCMTLYCHAADETESVFRRALDRYCDGRMDARTIALLEVASS
jgi:uncharacterized protein (DUF1810 family)